MRQPINHRIPATRGHQLTRDRVRMVPVPARYLIRIRGHLGPTVLAAFPDLDVRRHGAETVLTGLLDHSAMYGMLAVMEALNLDLLELRRLGPDPRSPQPGE